VVGRQRIRSLMDVLGNVVFLLVSDRGSEIVQRI